MISEKVSIEAIEKQKENLAISAEGFDIRTLFTNSGDRAPTSPEQSQQEIVRQEEEIENNEDPIVVYLQKIQGMGNSQPQCMIPSNSIECMTECIDRFKDWKMYQNDIRFVKLCLRYGSYSESPPMMFQFMESYSIGTFCAIFYDQWANYLETIKDIVQAKKVVASGIRLGAQPIAQLKQVQQDLNRRWPNTVLARRSTPEPPSNLARKRFKLDIYTGDSDDSEEEEEEPGDCGEVVPVHVPQIKFEKKENTQFSEPLIVTSRRVLSSSVRRLLAYRDDPGGSDLGINGADEKALKYQNNSKSSFSTQLIHNREFKEPLRPYAASERPMQHTLWNTAAVTTTATNGSGIPNIQKSSSLNPLLLAAISQPHQGITEVICSAQHPTAGGTEILK